MATLEELFQEDVLPKEMADRLVYSFGTLSELRRLTDLPVEYPFLDTGYILLPDDLARSFYKLCNRAWDIFIGVADRKAEFGGILDREKKRLKEKSKNFLAEWPALEEQILEEEAHYVINKVKEEQSFGYQDPCQPISFFNRVNSMAELAKKTGNQAQINFFWAALGAYLSGLFEKYMNEKRADGSVECSNYNRDVMFRHYIIKPILKSLFNSVSDKIGFKSGASFFFKGIDTAIVEKRIFGIDKEVVLGKLLLYPKVLKAEDTERIRADEYRIIRRQLLKYISRLSADELDSIFQNVKDAQKIVRALRENKEPGLTERLVYNPGVIDYVAQELSAINELMDQGIVNPEVTFGKFKELAKILQQQDWLVNIVYPNVVDVSKTSFKGKEEELYEKKKLADLTGKRAMFQNWIVGLVWGTDLVNSEKIREYFKSLGMTDKEAEDALHDIHYQFMLQNPRETKDNSIFWKHASKVGTKKVAHLYGGDGGVFLLEDDWVALRWLLAVKDYYEEQQALQNPEFIKKSGYDINYRSGAVFGYIPDKLASSEVIGVAKLLYTNGKEYGENGITCKDLEGRVYNVKSEFVLFASGQGKKGAIIYDLIGELKNELAILQDYINKGDENSLKKLPGKIKDALDEAYKELEEKKEKGKIATNAVLDVLLTECTQRIGNGEKVDNKVSRWPFRAYRTNLVKAPIIYLGEYAGKRPWEFDVYAVLPTSAHTDKFIKWYKEVQK